MVQTTRVKDGSGYRPGPNATCAYERTAWPQATPKKIVIGHFAALSLVISLN